MVIAELHATAQRVVVDLSRSRVWTRVQARLRANRRFWGARDTAWSDGTIVDIDTCASPYGNFHGMDRYAVTTRDGRKTYVTLTALDTWAPTR